MKKGTPLRTIQGKNARRAGEIQEIVKKCNVHAMPVDTGEPHYLPSFLVLPSKMLVYKIIQWDEIGL